MVVCVAQTRRLVREGPRRGSKTLRNHYERVICACCFLFLCVNIGFPSTSFNVYQPYIVAQMGDTNGSLFLALRTLVSMLCMLAVGRYYARLDCRLGVFLATLSTGVGFIVYGCATSFPVYCVGALFAGAGYGLGGMVAMTLLVGRWYRSRVGTAVGIAATGSGVASIVLPVIITHVIETLGLHWAFYLEAVLAVLLGVLVFALLRNRPADLGLEPYHNPDEDADHPVASRPEAEHSLTPPARRLMFVAMVFMGCITVDGWGYLSILMTSNGFDAYFAATLLTVAGVCLAVAKAVSGLVFDALGTRRASVIFLALMVAGLVLCCLAGTQSRPLMALAVVVFGFGASLGTVGISVWSIDLSTAAERARLVKDLQVAYALGGFVFNLLPGPLASVTGSYVPSYVILTVLGVLEALVVLGVYLSHRLRIDVPAPSEGNAGDEA